jgi:predicted type IV restriction endonuclease
MQQLNLPQYRFKIKSETQRKYIFDNIRRRYVLLTPEEWVRQHFTAWLVSEKKYPVPLIAVEMALKTVRMDRRADIVVFSRDGKPVMIIECKAPSIRISQKVFDQVARYNMNLKVDYLAVSNGMVHYCAKLDHEERTWFFLKEFPDFDAITGGNQD